MLDSLLNARPGQGAYAHSRSPSARDSAGGDDDVDKGVNFPMFLTMMGERLFEFDAEAELLEAFSSFDEDDSGTVRVEEMRKWLSETGDRMNQHEVCQLYYQQELLLTDICWIDRQVARRLFHGQARKLQLQGMGQGATCEGRRRRGLSADLVLI